MKVCCSKTFEIVHRNTNKGIQYLEISSDGFRILKITNWKCIPLFQFAKQEQWASSNAFLEESCPATILYEAP